MCLYACGLASGMTGLLLADSLGQPPHNDKYSTDSVLAELDYACPIVRHDRSSDWPTGWLARSLVVGGDGVFTLVAGQTRPEQN